MQRSAIGGRRARGVGDGFILFWERFRFETKARFWGWRILSLVPPPFPLLRLVLSLRRTFALPISYYYKNKSINIRNNDMISRH